MAGNDRKSSSKQTHASDALVKSGLASKDGTTADSEISGVTSRSLRSHLKLSPLVKEIMKSDSTKDSEKSPKSSPKRRNALKVVKTNRVVPYATRSLSALTILRNGKKKFDLNMLRLKRKQSKKKSTTDDSKADTSLDEKQASKLQRSPVHTLGPRKLRRRHFSNSETASKTSDCAIKAETFESSFSLDNIKDEVMSVGKYSVETVTLDSVPSGSPVISEILSDEKLCTAKNEEGQKSNVNVVDISSDNSSSFKMLSELQDNLCEVDNNSTSGSVEIITQKNTSENSCIVFDVRHCEGFLNPVIVRSEVNVEPKSAQRSEDSLPERLFLSESSIAGDRDELSNRISELELEGCPAEGGGAIICAENGESSIIRCISPFAKVNGNGSLLNINSEQESEPKTPTNDSISLLTADESVSFEDDLLTIGDSDQPIVAETTSDSESSSKKGFSAHFETLIMNNANESNQLTDTSLDFVNGKETSLEVKNTVTPSSVSPSNINKDKEKSLDGLEEMAAVTISSESSSLEYDEIRRKVDKALDPLEVDVSSGTSADATLNTQTLSRLESDNLKISIQTSLAGIVSKSLLTMSNSTKSRIEKGPSEEDPEKLVVISSSNSPVTINDRDDVAEEMDIGIESGSKEAVSNIISQGVSSTSGSDNALNNYFIHQEINSEMPSSNIVQQDAFDKLEKDYSHGEKDLSNKITQQKTNDENDALGEILIDQESTLNEPCSDSTMLETSYTDKKNDSTVEETCDGEGSSEKPSNKTMQQAISDIDEDDDSEEMVVDVESCLKELVNEWAQQETADTNHVDDLIKKMAINKESRLEKPSNETVQQKETDANEGGDSVEAGVTDKDKVSENLFDEMVHQEVTNTNEGDRSADMVIDVEGISEKTCSDILQQEASNCQSLTEKILISHTQENQLHNTSDQIVEVKALDVSVAPMVAESEPKNKDKKSNVESSLLDESCQLQKDEEIKNPSEVVKEVTSSSETAKNLAEDSAEQLAIKETMLNALGLQSSRAASLIKAPVRQGLPPIPSRTSGTLKTIIKVPRMVDKRRARNRVKLVLKKDKPTTEKEKPNSLQDQRFLSTEEHERLTRDAESMPYDQQTDEDPFAFHMFNESNVSPLRTWNPQLTKQKSKSQGISRKCMGNEPMSQLDLNRMNFSRNSIDGIVGSSSTEGQPKSNQDFDPNVASDGSSNSGRSTQQGSSEGTAEPCLVIPEKSSSFSIHPERLCHDVCCYCFGKFGSLDTPMHIAQMKGEDKRRAALTLEPHLSMDSCLCDACYRYLDRKSSCPSYQPYRRQSGISGGILTKPQVCCVRGCSLPAHHLVRRKWLNRLKRTISKLLPLEITPTPPNQQPSLHAPLCSRHYYCLEFYSMCGICKRKLSRNNMYPVGREVHELNSVLLDDSIPVTLTGKIFLCKMCRYYSGIRLKYRDKKMLSQGHKSFFDGYRKRIWHYLGIQKMDPSEVSAPIEIPKKRKKSKSTEEDSCHEAEQSKHLKLLEDPSKQSGESNSESSSDTSLHKPYNSTLPTKIRFKLGNVSIEHLGNADPNKKVSKTQMAETVTQSSSSSKKPESSKPKKRSSSDSIVKRPEFPGVDQLGLNASFLFHGTDDSKEWEKCTTTLQFDAKTKKLWQNLYYPYGNLSSFIRHLVIMERNWRNGDLVLAPNASSQAVNYVNSVQNRIAAYEGSVSHPHPKSTLPKHTVTKETGQKPVAASVPLPPASGILTSVPQKVTKDSVTVLPTTASPRITITNPQCPTNITTPITAQFIPINTATNFLPITPSQFISLGGPNSYIHIGSTSGLVHQIGNPYSCVQINQESVSEKDLMQKPIETPVIGPLVSSSSSSSSNSFDLHISNVRSLAGDAGNTNWESQSEKQVQSNDDLIINDTYDKDKPEDQEINSISVVPITPLTVVNTPPLEIGDSNMYLATVGESNSTDINQMNSLFKNV